MSSVHLKFIPEVHLQHFVPVNTNAFAFDEEDNLFVSESGNWELFYRPVEKDSNQYAMGLEFEGTSRTCIAHFELGAPINSVHLMERALETVAREMQAILLGVFDAKDRDLYLRDLFTIVRQVAKNGECFHEVNEVLSRIKPDDGSVDQSLDSIYWNAANFVRRYSPVHHMPVQFNSDDMYFLGLLKFGSQEAEFISMAEKGAQTLGFQMTLPFNTNYDEPLKENLTQLKANVEQLGFEFFP